MLKVRKNACLKDSEKGFTLIELLIATAVLSTVLLLASNAIIQVGKLYYKGLISTLTQEATRNLSEDVSKSIQLSKSGSVNRSDEAGQAFDTPQSVCVGDSRYTFVIDKQIGSDTKHALWVDQTPSSGCTEADLTQDIPTSDGKELLGPNMRLLKFDIINLPSSGVYKVDIKVAYGDDDLLTSYNDSGNARVDVDRNGTIDKNDSALALCKTGIAGSNFCATSVLDTVVKRRIN